MIEELRLAKEKLKKAREATATHKCDALDARKTTFVAQNENKKLLRQVDDLNLSLVKSENVTSALQQDKASLQADLDATELAMVDVEKCGYDQAKSEVRFFISYFC